MVGSLSAPMSRRGCDARKFESLAARRLASGSQRGTMSSSGMRLAAALAARLDPAVPRPFRIYAEGSDLTVDHPAGWGYRALVGSYLDDEIAPEYDCSWADGLYAPVTRRAEPTLVKRAETAVAAVLNVLQDTISEATGEPWPLAASRRMAPYGTRSDVEAVYFWYGDEEGAPVVAFAPIPLRDIRAED